MQQNPPAPKSGLGPHRREGAQHFWWQRKTAIANIPLIAILLAIILSLVGEPHATVVATLSNPLVALALIALMVSVVWHMRLGMQVIIEDYVPDIDRRRSLLLANLMFSIAVVGLSVAAVLKLALGH